MASNEVSIIICNFNGRAGRARNAPTSTIYTMSLHAFPVQFHYVDLCLALVQLTPVINFSYSAWDIRCLHRSVGVWTCSDRYLGSTLVDLSRSVKSDARYRARFRSAEHLIEFVSICRTRSYGTRNGLERAREHSAWGFRVR